jgi:hypothetical protein
MGSFQVIILCLKSLELILAHFNCLFIGHTSCFKITGRLLDFLDCPLQAIPFLVELNGLRP